MGHLCRMREIHQDHSRWVRTEQATKEPLARDVSQARSGNPKVDWWNNESVCLDDTKDGMETVARKCQ